MAAFLSGLSEQHFVADRNVIIEYRWAERRFERLPTLAADLVARGVTVIVVGGTPGAALAAKSATSTIPIVFNIGDDPVLLGLVASYNRPGGNATGTVALTSETAGKRLSLLYELNPQAKTIAYLLNPIGADAGGRERETLTEAANKLGLELHTFRVASEREFEGAFTNIRRLHADVLYVSAGTLFVKRRERITALALLREYQQFMPIAKSVTPSRAGGLSGEPPKAVIKDSGTKDGTS